ncbi:MAG TPA: hypothetical protein VHV30_07080 [Polyangiaceae bacterium]|jgi:hypothetical protein|nr:hypothetical protein [Polyangiaceae bacterium]
MTSPSEKDPARVWYVARALLDEEEDERLAKLPHDETVAAIQKEAAPYRGKAPDLKDFLAKVDAKAAKQAAAGEPATSVKGAPVPVAASAGAAADPPKVVHLASRRRWRPVVAVPTTLALAAASWLLAVWATDPDDGRVGAANDDDPTAADVANAMRHEAVDLCKKDRWRECLAELEDANRIDPNGAAEPWAKRLTEIARETVAGLADGGAVPR